MSSTASVLTDIEVLRRQANAADRVVKLNVEGLSHEDSLLQPQPAGNCLNWVLGHLLCIYNQVLPLLGQKPVLESAALKRYDRGSPPIQNPAEALKLEELKTAWDETCKRVDTGLAALTAQKLDSRAPVSPNNDPNETVRSLLSVISFHQAYHAGQLGTLRRLAGKEGAIR